MPVAAFEGEVVVVDQPDQVADAIAYLRTQKIVGVDTEARPSFQRGIHYPTALVQIAKSFCRPKSRMPYCATNFWMSMQLAGVKLRLRLNPFMSSLKARPTLHIASSAKKSANSCGIPICVNRNR